MLATDGPAVTVTVKVWSVKLPAASVARTRMS